MSNVIMLFLFGEAMLSNDPCTDVPKWCTASVQLLSVYLTKEARILLSQVARLFLPQDINGCNQFLCSDNSEV
jgi:hypothetical protein